MFSAAWLSFTLSEPLQLPARGNVRSTAAKICSGRSCSGSKQRHDFVCRLCYLFPAGNPTVRPLNPAASKYQVSPTFS